MRFSLLYKMFNFLLPHSSVSSRQGLQKPVASPKGIIEDILSGRWVKDIYPSREAFKATLYSGKKLTFYLGADPTGPYLHLGHSTNLFVMRKLQDLGHKAVFLIGDFTARIGDPSGRTTERVPLSKEEVQKNGRTFKKQAGHVVRFYGPNSAHVAYNSAWLSKLSFADVVRLASKLTVQQMLARDMFQARIVRESPIGLHEFLYPLMQGYDSVALKTDGEIGGNDQLFNMLVGRDLVRSYLNKEKFVLTTPLLLNPATGKKLMSKSEGGVIGLEDAPNDMFGKVMALPDGVTEECFLLCTELRREEITSIMALPPRESKARLGEEIVRIYHGAEMAARAAEEFSRVFHEHQLPEDVKETEIKEERLSVLDVILRLGFARSKGEARRLVVQGGVFIDGTRKTDAQELTDIKNGMVVRVGKRHFARVKHSQGR